MQMIMMPFTRKLALTAHITFSVGWLGAVAGFLALSIAGLTSEDATMVRSAYLTMELICWFVIVPASIGSLLSGLIQSLGTHWGLFRHYWIVVKLLLTVVCTILLLLHMEPISNIADIASRSSLTSSELRGLRIQLIADASVALGVLLIATTLSVYKPWGKTAFATRNQNGSQTVRVAPAKSKSGKYVMIGLVCLFILFIILHLAGGGLGQH